jgi:hypothetical protein
MPAFDCLLETSNSELEFLSKKTKFQYSGIPRFQLKWICRCLSDATLLLKNVAARKWEFTTILLLA